MEYQERQMDITKVNDTYPYVLLPYLIEKHLSEPFNEAELIKELNIEFPKKQHCATRNNHTTIHNPTSSPILTYIENLLNNNKPKEMKIELEEILDLNYTDINHELESETYFIDTIELPKKPILHKPEEIKIELNYWGFLIIFFPIWISFALFWITLGYLPFKIISENLLELINIKGLALQLSTISIVSTLLFLFFQYNKNDYKKKIIVHKLISEDTIKNERIINDYKKKIIQIFENYNKKIEEEISNLQNHIETNRTNFEIQYLKSKITKDILQYSTVENIKKGYSEEKFFGYLKMIFNDNVKVNKAPLINKPYIPDFLIIDDDLGIYLDIEIDEPYVFGTGEIIHYNESNDSKRDLFFINNTWIVIRFSENQVLAQPKDCALFIKNILEAIKKKKKWVNTNIIEEKKWTFNEALMMKTKNSRSTK